MTATHHENFDRLWLPICTDRPTQIHAFLSTYTDTKEQMHQCIESDDWNSEMNQLHFLWRHFHPRPHRTLEADLHATVACKTIDFKIHLIALAEHDKSIDARKLPSLNPEPLRGQTLAISL